MTHVSFLALTIALALAGTAQAVDVYKWKDGQGVVHYGDRPASGIAAKPVSMPDDALSAEEEAAANERLERARAKLAEPVPADDPPPVVPRRRKVATASCAEDWLRFDAAQACYASHRMPNGRGVSTAGMALCRPMAQPTCAR